MGHGISPRRFRRFFTNSVQSFGWSPCQRVCIYARFKLHNCWLRALCSLHLWHSGFGAEVIWRGIGLILAWRSNLALGRCDTVITWKVWYSYFMIVANFSATRISIAMAGALIRLCTLRDIKCGGYSMKVFKKYRLFHVFPILNQIFDRHFCLILHSNIN